MKGKRRYSMAKFCGNCGMKLDDSAKVCGNCGTPLNGDISKNNDIMVKNTKNKKNFGKTLKGLFVLVVLVAVVFVGINIALNFTGNRALVHKVMAAYEDYDIETIISLSSDVHTKCPKGYEEEEIDFFEQWNDELQMYEYITIGLEEYVERYFKSNVGGALDFFELSVGHNYKFSYEINEIYEMSEQKKEELFQKIESKYYEFDMSFISEIVVADITVTATQGDKSASREVQLTMTKEHDAWKVLYLE